MATEPPAVATLRQGEVSCRGTWPELSVAVLPGTSVGCTCSLEVLPSTRSVHAAPESCRHHHVQQTTTAAQSCSWCGSLPVGPADFCSTAASPHIRPGACLPGTPLGCTCFLHVLHVTQHSHPMPLSCPAGCSGGFMPLTQMQCHLGQRGAAPQRPHHSRSPPSFVCSVCKQIDALQGLPGSSTPAAAKPKPEGPSSWQTPAPVFPDAPTPATAAPASGWQDIYAGAAGKPEALVASWLGLAACVVLALQATLKPLMHPGWAAHHEFFTQGAGACIISLHLNLAIRHGCGASGAASCSSRLHLDMPAHRVCELL